MPTLKRIDAEATAKIHVHIRWMIRRDMPEVLEIENTRAFPWDEAEFLKWLRHRHCIGMVAEHGERIVGFMVYLLHKDSLALLNLAVDSSFQRHGVGHQMVTKLIGKLSAHRRSSLALTIRETNLDGQMFFRAMGFLAKEVTQAYFDDTEEDAYWMEYNIDESFVSTE